MDAKIDMSSETRLLDQVGTALDSSAVQACVLALVGGWAFLVQGQMALYEGSEGLYAQIAREMTRSGELFQLTYMGDQYLNKPPLFFWMLAASTWLFGEHEAALRLPSMLFCLGTMGLTYGLGVLLFSRTAGFWAALVVGSSHGFLWYGPRVLFEAGVVFAITLALYAWLRAYLHRGGGWWYWVSFLAMAFGTMVKGLHALALPLVVIVLFSSLRRDFRWIVNPFFLTGPLLFVGVVSGYASVLGAEFGWHYDYWSRLLYALDTWHGRWGSGDGKPVLYYFYMLWFGFFPWCALLPPGLALMLLARRPFRERPGELFVLAWMAGMLGALTLGQPKREPYLVPLIPSLGLLVGWLYEEVRAERAGRRIELALRLCVSVLAAFWALSLFIWQPLLAKRWSSAIGAFPLWYVIPMLAICALVVFAAVRASARSLFLAFGGLALGFLVGVKSVLLPAIDEATSARRVSEEIRAFAERADQPVHLYSSGWPKNEDLEYYLRMPPALPKIQSEQGLLALARDRGGILIATERQRAADLAQRADVEVATIREFPQPRRKTFYLLSVSPTGRLSSAHRPVDGAGP